MVVDGRFDYSSYGRGIANPNLSAGFARLIMACERMAEADPGREAEYAAFLKRLRGDADAKPLVGNRSFWRSDYMAHRRPDFFASVRMTSPRVRLVERGVGSNMRGEFLSDGVTFFQRTGKEYDGIFPVWDWRRLPGITSEQKSEPPLVPSAKDRYGERDYAGSVSDGMYGLAAMDFARGPLAARKAWLFLDREIVCLGTGIANTSDTLICTTVNQCLLKGPLTLFEKSRKREAAIGEGTLLPSSWVYHDGIGYVFPEQPGVSWKAETRKGSWGDINLDCPQDEVSADVFSLWIDHGAHPAGAAYHYAVAPGLALEEMDAYAQSPPYVELSNTPACQAIWSAEAGVLAAAFYEPGSTAAPGVARFSVDQPCLLLARREPPRMGGTAEDVWFVSVSNPACQPLDVAVAIDLEAPAPAASARLLFNLLDGLYAGQSVAQAFREQ